MATTFTRMDESTAEQWGVIGAETYANRARVEETVLAMLRSLADITDGFAVDQLTHSLQTATMAERAGADDEVVVAALCHDIGKAVSVPNHPRIAAEILRPYVRDDVYRVVRHHQDFTARYIAPIFGGDADRREQWRGQSWFGLAEEFVDEWDQLAFDRDYATKPLEHFAPLVRTVFAPRES